MHGQGTLLPPSETLFQDHSVHSQENPIPVILRSLEVILEDSPGIEDLIFEPFIPSFVVVLAAFLFNLDFPMVLDTRDI